jgi:hypothetical protein
MNKINSDVEGSYRRGNVGWTCQEIKKSWENNESDMPNNTNLHGDEATARAKFEKNIEFFEYNNRNDSTADEFDSDESVDNVDSDDEKTQEEQEQSKREDKREKEEAIRNKNNRENEITERLSMRRQDNERQRATIIITLPIATARTRASLTTNKNHSLEANITARIRKNWLTQKLHETISEDSGINLQESLKVSKLKIKIENTPSTLTKEHDNRHLRMLSMYMKIKMSWKNTSSVHVDAETWAKQGSTILGHYRIVLQELEDIMGYSPLSDNTPQLENKMNNAAPNLFQTNPQIIEEIIAQEAKKKHKGYFREDVHMCEVLHNKKLRQAITKVEAMNDKELKKLRKQYAEKRSQSTKRRTK